MSKINVGDLVSWGVMPEDQAIVTRICGDKAYFADDGWTYLTDLHLLQRKHPNYARSAPAFPLPCGSETTEGQEGMTLRDYFAAKAMAALMPIYWETQEEYESAKEMVKCQVESAYEYADAMILQRGK